MKNVVIVSLFFSAILTIAAQTNIPPVLETSATTRAMSLQDCIQEALAHNFDVQIQRYNPKISLYNLSAAYDGWDAMFNVSGKHSYNASAGGFNPNSTNPIPARITKSDSFNSGINGTLPWGLQYDLSGNVGETRSSTGSEDSSGSVGVTLTQPLLKNFWIDSTRLNIRVAKNRLKYSEQGLRWQVIQSVTAVANAYYELIYAQENVKVQQDALKLAQTQLSQDQQRMQIGTLAQLSVQQDQSQVAQDQANLIAAEDTLSTDQNILKNLLTDNYHQWHDVDIQPSESLAAPMEAFDLQDSWSRGMSERPDLLQQRLDLEQQGIQLKYDRNQLFPELDLVGSYGFNGAGAVYDPTLDQIGRGNRPFYSYGAQLSMPLGNLGPRNNYKATKATLQQVLLQLKQFEQNVLVDIDNAVKDAESKYESVQATKQARIYAQAALDAEQKTYAVGKATTFEVLQYENSLTAARSQEIRALADYNEALANLAEQEGSTLDRYRIDLNIGDDENMSLSVK